MVNLLSGINFGSPVQGQAGSHKPQLPKPSSTSTQSQFQLPEKPQSESLSPLKSFDNSEPAASWENKAQLELPFNRRDENNIEWLGRDSGVPEKMTSLSRRVALQDFLRKMEEELGIDANQIVTALSQLTMNELMMPPEKTVEKVLDQMGLGGKKREKALFFFQDMLKQSFSSNMAESLKGKDHQTSLEALSLSELHKKKINESIDKMSQHFFVDEQAISQRLGTGGFTQAGFSIPADSGSQIIPEGMEQVKSLQPIDNHQIGFNEEMLEPMIKNDQVIETAEVVSNETVQKPSEMNFEGDASQMDAENDMEWDLQAKSKSEAATKGEFVVNGPKMTKVQEAQNVREVIDQAQVMIRSGGGKVKIKMNPEGMGEVTLKVATEGEKVNVEMIASNMDTKKLLEKGLEGLKNTLSSHKLNVDLVKVNLAEQTSEHMDQQLQDQKQRLAQHFMNEFRQNNQAWREDFVGAPGIHSYKSQTQDEDSNQGLTLHEIKQKRRGRRLDLVA